MSDYDLIIIGSGPAGYTAALEAVKHSMKPVIIEREPSRLGGVCLSEGCIPLKGLLYHSHVTKDYPSIRDLVMKRVEGIRSGLRSRLQGQGVDILTGEARFISPSELSIDETVLRAKYFLIAAGSCPKRLFDYSNVYTSEKIFTLGRVPGRSLIIGGGVVGCEYASFLSAMGGGVDIVEALDSPLYGEDEESVRSLLREFKKRRIGVYAKSRIVEITSGNEVILSTGQGERREKYDIIFETTGRRPATHGLGLDVAGVAVSEKGFVAVDVNMGTSNSAIYAAGDCIDTPMLAYTAVREAETAVRHMATGIASVIDYASMPRLVFSMPQVGSVGVTEKEAAEKGMEYRVYRYFFKALGKAVVEGRDSGFIKLIVDSGSETIAGAAVVGDDIADIVNQLALIHKTGLKVGDILDCMYIHPSYSEIIAEALLYGRQ